ncbi:hypothetical protein B0H63DRAFT_450033 [Podospora didyma]|uniref:Heterokaryon incompatibility domain-containing protein n=1 Tax=Podospora didyma TaxID=330526 RepID=A0AAE0NQW6_9PEZI|nr:hypothetical protein B0H63DRAFT_450033 [Podospora didyma]
MHPSSPHHRIPLVGLPDELLQKTAGDGVDSNNSSRFLTHEARNRDLLRAGKYLYVLTANGSRSLEGSTLAYYQGWLTLTLLAEFFKDFEGWNPFSYVHFEEPASRLDEIAAKDRTDDTASPGTIPEIALSAWVCVGEEDSALAGRDEVQFICEIIDVALTDVEDGGASIKSRARLSWLSTVEEPIGLDVPGSQANCQPQDKKGRMSRMGWCPSRVTRARDEFDTIAAWVFLEQISGSAARGGSDSRQFCLGPYLEQLFPGLGRGDGERAASDATPIKSNIAVRLVAVDIDDANDAPTFAALSHVWSEGMGNATANSLPMCRLGMVHLWAQLTWRDVAENAFSRSEKEFTVADGPIFREIDIWIDTLCCPATPGYGKNLCLSRMRDIYARATAVPVITTSLQKVQLMTTRLEEEGISEQDGDNRARIVLDIVSRLHGEDGSTFKGSDEETEGLRHGEKYDKDNNKCLNWFLLKLTETLRYRSLSVAADEPICLATLLGLQIRPSREQMDVSSSRKCLASGCQGEGDELERGLEIPPHTGRWCAIKPSPSTETPPSMSGPDNLLSVSKTVVLLLEESLTVGEIIPVVLVRLFDNPDSKMTVGNAAIRVQTLFPASFVRLYDEACFILQVARQCIAMIASSVVASSVDGGGDAKEVLGPDPEPEPEPQPRRGDAGIDDYDDDDDDDSETQMRKQQLRLRSTLKSVDFRPPFLPMTWAEADVLARFVVIVSIMAYRGGFCGEKVVSQKSGKDPLRGWYLAATLVPNRVANPGNMLYRTLVVAHQMKLDVSHYRRGFGLPHRPAAGRPVSWEWDKDRRTFDKRFEAAGQLCLGR